MDTLFGRLHPASRRSLPSLRHTLLLACAIASGCSSTPGSEPRETDAGAIDDATSDAPPVFPCVDPDGDGYGPNCPNGEMDCAPEDPTVAPGFDERCGDAVDNDCDGQIDEGCGCTDGAIERCYEGPDATADIGICSSGTRRCETGQWSPCEGQRVPVAAEEVACDGQDEDCDGRVDEGVTNACGECGAIGMEVCGDGLDNNCNGQIDEPEAGCACDGRENQACYSGPPSTLGFGACRGGVASCTGDLWGECVGEQLPSEELCNGIDDDCDGRVDEGLRNACGTCGPAPIESCNGIDDDCDGEIDEGVRLACGVCPGEAADETCGDGLDNDCDGEVDEGCPCASGEPSCYPGSPETRGIGRCTDGVRSCDPTGEFWGVCEAFVLPAPEVCNGEDDNCDGVIDRDARGCSVCELAVETCNGEDDDCDGEVDEGLRNACGQCLEDVPEETLCDGRDDNCNGLIDEGLLNACGTCGDSCYLEQWDDPSDWATGDLEGLDPNTEDGLRLGTVELREPDLWVANTDDDTVTRIRTDTGAVVGTYPVGHKPSRTAVDFEGNVWVANRAFDQQGTVTKVLGADCEGDACVAFTVPVGGNDGIPRGLAIDRFGDVWVGLYNDRTIARLDPSDGTVLGTYDVGVRVYGLAIDRTGLIWIAALNDNAIVAFDPEALEVIGTFEPEGCVRPYGIAVDANGDLWLGNWTCDDVLHLVRSTLDTPGGPEFRRYDHPTLSRTRGITIDSEGMVYVAASGTERVAKLDPTIAARAAAGETGPDGEALSPWVWTVETCEDPIGLGVANDGDIWAVCNRADSTERFAPDGTSRGRTDVGDAPYSYSDITGFQLRNFTAPTGYWRVVFDCERADCQFDALTWDAEVPPMTELAVRARSASGAPDDWSAWTERFVGAPVSLVEAVPPGRWLEVEVRLTSEAADASPVLRRVDVSWQRP
jgi:DNA-binding beta-propeller fold protein YncE